MIINCMVFVINFIFKTVKSFMCRLHGFYVKPESDES